MENVDKNMIPMPKYYYVIRRQGLVSDGEDKEENGDEDSDKEIMYGLELLREAEVVAHVDCSPDCLVKGKAIEDAFSKGKKVI
ncbi:hypothetical protein SUGI_0525410 [Cryptomeria japonica]|nr:hypothetical protein SUGI_0525410 [Cryptomeria japonica]